jgi:hypothetical protein
MEWMEEIVYEYFRDVDVQKILSIRLPSRPTEDFISWLHEKSGVFSVRSAYRLAKEHSETERGAAQSSSEGQAGRPIWKRYWSTPLPHKILIFGWKVINNGLASRMNKISRHIVTIGTCEICGREDESIMHALLWCNHAVSLREAMRQYWELPDEEQYRSMAPSSLLHILETLGRVLVLLWRTWQVRNDITHENGKFSIEGSVSFMRRYWVELCNARQEDGHGDLHGKSPVLDSLVAGKQR